MVSTLDSESSDPSSNLGGTCFWLQVFAIGIFISVQLFQILQVLDSLVVRISACHVEGPGSMVSTLDSESSDPSSNLGGTCFWLQVFAIGIFISVQLFQILQVLDSLVVRISACHVEGPGSIPGRGDHFLFMYKFSWLV